MVSEQQFNRWRNTWIALTLIVFLAGNFWIYAVLGGLLLYYVAKQEQNPFALFFVLLLAIPRISDKIPGLGIVNFLIEVDYITILSLTVLLPAYLSLRTKRETAPFLSFWPDRLIFAYMIIVVLLLMRDTTTTDALRMVIRNFTDIFLPYYVASRSLKHVQQFKEVLAAFVIAAMVAGVMAMFEFSRFWLLYANLKGFLGVPWEMGSYLGRGDNLRALVTLGQPIILGYVMLLALGFYIFTSKAATSRPLRWLGWSLILGGLYVPLSRGPWVGAVVLTVIFIIVSPNKIKNIAKLAAASVLSAIVLNIIPAGQKIINLIPFIGETEVENVDYRVRLINAAFIVFQRYPLFGSTKFKEELAALGMTQGEGIVDIVNQYLWIVLERGLIGLMLFVGFFSIIIFQLFVHINNSINENNDTLLLGRTLFACLIATMVTITTVSGILVLPVIYWALGGLSLAYCRMLELQEVSVQANEFKSYRLAFDAMPALPATKLVFSTLTTHRVIVDNKPIPRVKLKSKTNSNQDDISTKFTPSPREIKPSKSPKPELGSIYQQARKISPNPQQAYFAKTLQLPPKTKVQTNESLIKVGKVRVLSGSNSGKEFVLSKVLSKLGKTGVQVAIVSRRNSGYYLTHLEGKVYPIVNNISIGERAHLLNDQDMIEILGIKMQFHSDESA